METLGSLESVSFSIAFTADLYSIELSVKANSDYEHNTMYASYQQTLNNAIIFIRAINGNLRENLSLFCMILGY